LSLVNKRLRRPLSAEIAKIPLASFRSYNIINCRNKHNIRPVNSPGKGPSLVNARNRPFKFILCASFGHTAFGLFIRQNSLLDLAVGHFGDREFFPRADFVAIGDQCLRAAIFGGDKAICLLYTSDAADE